MTMNQRWTEPFARRRFFRAGAMGLGYSVLASMLQGEANPSRFPQRAKRVIFLFMKGGPSQVDTFDFKPALQRDHGKPLPFAKPKFSSPRPETCLPRPGLSTDTARAVIPSASFFRIYRVMPTSFASYTRFTEQTLLMAPPP